MCVKAETDWRPFGLQKNLVPPASSFFFLGVVWSPRRWRCRLWQCMLGSGRQKPLFKLKRMVLLTPPRPGKGVNKNGWIYFRYFSIPSHAFNQSEATFWPDMIFVHAVSHGRRLLIPKRLLSEAKNRCCNFVQISCCIPSISKQSEYIQLAKIIYEAHNG